MRHSTRMLTAVGAVLLLSGAALGAQTPALGPSERLRAVLPADVAERVIAKIAEARARQLPAAALENRALKFAAKGVAPAAIERSVAQQAERMARAKAMIAPVRGRVADDEVEAGAEALRKGVDGAQVSALAQSAPSGRSLAVPLYVVGSLVERGLPSDQALQRVQERLQARSTDAELERMPGELPSQAAEGQARRPTEVGRELAATKRGSGAAGGAPAGVPANGGAISHPQGPSTSRPGVPTRP